MNEKTSKKPGRHCLKSNIIINVTSNINIMCLLIKCADQNTILLPWYSYKKNAQHKFNCKEISDKTKLWDILQNNWTVSFKSVKVMTDRKRLRDSSTLKET